MNGCWDEARRLGTLGSLVESVGEEEEREKFLISSVFKVLPFLSRG